MRPSQVLKRLNELRKVYQEQTFRFTSEQQKEYDNLKEVRRERVKYFYDNDLVFRGSAKKEDTKYLKPIERCHTTLKHQVN